MGRIRLLLAATLGIVLVSSETLAVEPPNGTINKPRTGTTQAFGSGTITKRSDGSSSTRPFGSGVITSDGPGKSLEYLVGEKFLNFLEAAETDTDFRAEIPAFVAKIKEIFEPWQLAQYLATARNTEPFDPDLFTPRWHPILGEEKIEMDAEEIEELRKEDIRRCTRDLLLVERAREWLVEVAE